MAATGTPTPNLGLRIPQGTDPASVDDINYNSNLLDTKIGAIGNDSVKTQIDALNSNLSFTVDSSANVANGDWATGAEKYGDNDNLIFVKYKNGIVHAYGLFKITTASSAMKVCDIPTGYRASATAQPTQPWGVATRNSGGKSYAIRVPYSAIYFWGDTPETGAYSIDMWWKT